MKRYYRVAGHVFCVTAEADNLGLMGNYEPFRCESCETVFSLAITDGIPVNCTEVLRQEDEGQEIICCKSDEGHLVFEFILWNQTAGWLVCSDDYREGRLIIKGKFRKLAINNALMILFALATADKDTLLFHAAVVSHQGRGYMFLGKSGTGKSTHAKLWLKHIDGTELVNDDNPVVRIHKDKILVYGSPWSGKTPCYRNVSYPLGGIVTLSQASYNTIEPLKGLEAYAALVSSISGMRWDEKVADGLHQSENELAMSVPMWHLECLPDETAARLCLLTIDS